MNLETLTQWAEPAGAVIGFLLTIMVLSYIIGDNFLFRLAIHIFIGVASGYAAVLVFYNVLWNQVIVPLLQFFVGGAPPDALGSVARILPAVVMGVWMLAKISPRLARVGNPVLAFLVGVGAATALGGAVLGSIFPQVSASADALNLQIAPAEKLAGWFVNGIFLLVGTVTTLSYFHFGVRTRGEGTIPQRNPVVEFMATIGQGFIVITLGILFSGVYFAALAALINRVMFIWMIIQDFLQIQ